MRRLVRPDSSSLAGAQHTRCDCQGVYFSVRPWSRLYADRVELHVAVRLTHPARVTEVPELAELVGLSRATGNPVEVRRRLLDLGYDGALTADAPVGLGPSNQFIVALRHEDIRVVVP